MDTNRPAQLSYLVIFNPTLRPPSPTDDEDDIEQASILLYTARSRAVSRDTMLRQVGLAKALINFSELFTPEAGCDNVHSQKKRLVMFSPEPNFWLHICVDLPCTKREPSQGQKTTSKGKGKEPTTSPGTAQLDYVDNSLYDRVLRDDLKAAYEGFRIVHGTFAEILHDEGTSALETRLEQYFNMWAWQWDLSETSEFPVHLGIPLHHRHQKLSACIDDLLDSTSFILQHNPLSILYLPQPTEPPDLYALMRYVLTSSHPAIPSLAHVHVESNTGHTSLTDSSATIVPPTLPSSSDPISKPNGEPLSSPRPVSHIGSTVAAPFTHAGAYLKPTLHVVNPKRWWPGYLTVQRSSSRSDFKDSSPEAEPKPATNGSEYLVSEAKPPNEEHLEPVPSNNIPRDDPHTPEAKHDAGASSSLRSPSPTESFAQNGHLDIDQAALEDAMIDATPPRCDVDSELEAYPPLPPSPPPLPPFTQLPVRILHALDPLRTEQRTLLHVWNYGLTFALLLAPGQHEYDINDRLLERVDDCLRRLRSTLDNPSMTDLLHPVSSAPSRAILFDGSTSTMTVVPAPTNEGQPHLFAALESFQKHPWLQEITSRTTSNQWFASRKSPGSLGNKTTHKTAFLESGNTQASLVDVDSELSTVIRAWQ